MSLGEKSETEHFNREHVETVRAVRRVEHRALSITVALAHLC